MTHNQAGNSNYLAANQVAESTTAVAWTISGFFQPVDMSSGSTAVLNTVKGGSTVPLKFRIFAGATEQTSTTAVLSIMALKVTCTNGAIEDQVEETVTTTGGTALRYDTTDGQFIDNWKTPKGTAAGVCYRVTMTAADNSQIWALFKLK